MWREVRNKPFWAILISSGLIVIVNKSSFIFSLHSNIDPLISILLSEILLALNKLVVPIKFAENAVFGSNTSTLPISGLAQNSSRPDNFIGIHYFSPVEKMPLVEIIPAVQTS